MNDNGSNDMFPQGFIDMMNADAVAAAAAVRADCTHCQDWEICPFHPAPAAVEPATAVGEDVVIETVGVPVLGPTVLRGVSRLLALPTGARLLGLDDPEVSADLIYAVPGGGVMGVPQAASAANMSVVTAASPKLDRATQWRCKDGRVLLIAEMSDGHLCNTIRLCIRKYEENLEASWSAAASFDSDSMASYYACGAASDVSPSPSLPYLQAEAKRRGVSW